MYPGGAPKSLETLCFSINSLISKRIIAFSSSNKNFAKALADCVFPTPVGPKNKKLPIGLLSVLSPAVLRLILFFF